MPENKSRSDPKEASIPESVSVYEKTSKIAFATSNRHEASEGAAERVVVRALIVGCRRGDDAVPAPVIPARPAAHNGGIRAEGAMGATAAARHHTGQT